MLIDHLNRQRLEREAQGLTRQRRIAEFPSASRQRVSQSGQPARELRVFGSNDYLGLANHPALVQALADGAQQFGAGSGSLSHFRLRSERLIYMGMLGKAAGVGGAFVAAHPTIIDWLVQSARPYIYTTAAPPAVAHALRESLRLIGGPEGEQRRSQLQQLINQLRTELAALIAAHPALGWQLAASRTAVQPLIVGSNEAALALMAALDAQGLWCRPSARPRCQSERPGCASP